MQFMDNNEKKVNANEGLTRDTQIETQAGSRLPKQEPREGAVSRTPGCCMYLSLVFLHV